LLQSKLIFPTVVGSSLIYWYSWLANHWPLCKRMLNTLSSHAWKRNLDVHLNTIYWQKLWDSGHCLMPNHSSIHACIHPSTYTDHVSIS
jgi:hypothetical protein